MPQYPFVYAVDHFVFNLMPVDSAICPLDETASLHRTTGPATPVSVRRIRRKQAKTNVRGYELGKQKYVQVDNATYLAELVYGEITLTIGPHKYPGAITPHEDEEVREYAYIGKQLVMVDSHEHPTYIKANGTTYRFDKIQKQPISINLCVVMLVLCGVYLIWNLF